jgi:uncharacterized protein YggE
MKSLIPALAAVALLAVATPAGARTTSAARPIAHIDVTGQGSVDRMPDQVVVSFSIVTNDDNATRATSAANTTYDALVTHLRALGLTPDAIKTTSYSVNYNARPPQPNPQYQQRYGFVVSRSVAVTSAKTDQVGAIIDAGIAAGVTSVSDVAFGLHDNRAAYRTALAAAIADADAQARAIAAAAHVRIVRVLTIGAGGAVSPIRPVTRFATMAAAAPPPVPTDVQPSNLSVSATVSVSYQIAP